jgi:hypothetical protein
MSYVPAKRATEFIFYMGLTSQATGLLQNNPTLAAGDFKVSIDGGALANLTTLPTVTPAAGRQIKVTLSSAEMTGDNITVQCVDAAGAEWVDQVINIQPSVRQIDDLAFPTVSGRSLDVTATGAAGIDWANLEGSTTANNLSSTTTNLVNTATLAVTTTTLTNSGNPKKNTALAAFPFLMTATSTHDPVTGATVTVTRSIDGGAFASGSLSVVTEVANGIYVVDFAAGDLNGNNIILMATATGCDVTLERITTAL